MPDRNSPANCSTRAGSNSAAAFRVHRRNTARSAVQTMNQGRDARLPAGAPCAARAVGAMPAIAVAWFRHRRICGKSPAIPWEVAGDTNARAESQPSLPRPDAEHHATRLTSERKRYLHEAELCASNPCTDDIPPRSAAAALRSRGACKSSEKSARRRAPDFSLDVSRRLSPHRHGRQFLGRFVRVRKRVFGSFDRVLQSVLISLVFRTAFINLFEDGQKFLAFRFD